MVLFDGRNILADGNTAFSLVGMTPAKAKEVGVDDPRRRRAERGRGHRRVQRAHRRRSARDCWVALEQEDHGGGRARGSRSWTPRPSTCIGPAVTKYDFDQNGTEMALSHVAVDPSLQK